MGVVFIPLSTPRFMLSSHNYCAYAIPPVYISSSLLHIKILKTIPIPNDHNNYSYIHARALEISKLNLNISRD